MRAVLWLLALGQVSAQFSRITCSDIKLDDSVIRDPKRYWGTWYVMAVEKTASEGAHCSQITLDATNPSQDDSRLNYIGSRYDGDISKGFFNNPNNYTLSNAKLEVVNQMSFDPPYSLNLSLPIPGYTPTPFWILATDYNKDSKQINTVVTYSCLSGFESQGFGAQLFIWSRQPYFVAPTTFESMTKIVNASITNYNEFTLIPTLQDKGWCDYKYGQQSSPLSKHKCVSPQINFDKVPKKPELYQDTWYVMAKTLVSDQGAECTQIVLDPISNSENLKYIGSRTTGNAAVGLFNTSYSLSQATLEPVNLQTFDHPYQLNLNLPFPGYQPTPFWFIGSDYDSETGEMNTVATYSCLAGFEPLGFGGQIFIWSRKPYFVKPTTFTSMQAQISAAVSNYDIYKLIPTLQLEGWCDYRYAAKETAGSSGNDSCDNSSKIPYKAALACVIIGSLMMVAAIFLVVKVCVLDKAKTPNSFVMKKDSKIGEDSYAQLGSP